MKILATNRRARHDYELKDTLITGVVLTGAEVKSAKLGHISLKGAYVNVLKGELYLINAHISPYKYANAPDFDETRSRKLLIHKAELDRLLASKQAGMAMVPLAVGLQKGLVKIEVGVGRGKKQYDKRQAIKKRDAERDAARTVAAKTRPKPKTSQAA